MWDAWFGDRVAAFRLRLVSSARRGNRIGPLRTTYDICQCPLRTAGICSRRRHGNKLWALGILNWGTIVETVGAVCDCLLLRLVASEMPPHRFGSVIKQVALTGVLVLLIASLLAGCTSMTSETLSDPSSSQSGAAVPGEKMSDDERYAPGPMGSSNVRW